MSPVHLNVVRFLALTSISILVVIALVKIVSNDGQSRYYEKRFQRAKLADLEAVKTATLNIDPNIKEPLEWENLEQMQRELPNVPFDFWFHYYENSIQQKDNCNEYPHLLSLNFYNTYWQTFQNNNITFQLFGAYYDKRASLPNGPVVRVLAMINSKEEFSIPESSCQLWFNNRTDPVIVPVQKYHLIYPKYWGLIQKYLYPYLITCESLPDTERDIPRTISLVKTNCEKPRNNLRIWFEEPTAENPKREFAVCVKGLHFPYFDNSARLIEWLELLRILGASKVFIYSLAVHANVSKVLSYYESTGLVEVTKLTLANGTPNLPNFQYAAIKSNNMRRRLNEYIPYNDCFYRNMYKYDYLAAIDVDEVIMPKGNFTNWHQITQIAKGLKSESGEICENGFASFCFLNSYFPDMEGKSSSNPNLPKYMYMLQHTLRMREHSDANTATKCFHNTAEAETLQNHFSLSWLKSCRPITIDKDIAQLQHYRNPKTTENESSSNDFKDLKEEVVQDESIFRFKDELFRKTVRVLKKLQFLQI